MADGEPGCIALGSEMGESWMEGERELCYVAMGMRLSQPEKAGLRCHGG